MRERRYHVYIMASKSRRICTGITNNIYCRALQHKSGEIGGFTKRYNINRLVYYEEFSDVGAAIARETQIKGLDRAKRVALIESQNPTWEDLAEDWGKQAPIRLDPNQREVFAFSTNGPRSDAEKQIPRRCAPRDDRNGISRGVGDSASAAEKQIPRRFASRDDNTKKFRKSEMMVSKTKV